MTTPRSPARAFTHRASPTRPRDDDVQRRNFTGRPCACSRLGHIAPTLRRGNVVASPLVETKLFAPHPRGDPVDRPRLFELLDLGRRARLTLISAPAGFGKTTLLSNWLTAPDGQRRPFAWVSLEERRQPSRTVLDLSGHRLAPRRCPESDTAPWHCSRAPSRHRDRPGHAVSTSSARCRPSSTWSSTTTTSSTTRTSSRAGIPARAPATAGAPGDQHPRRPGTAAGAAARPRRPGRGTCRRSAFHPSEAAAFLNDVRARAHRRRHRRP